jgi:hypothetical protein
MWTITTIVITSILAAIGLPWYIVSIPPALFVSAITVMAIYLVSCNKDAGFDKVCMKSFFKRVM